MPTWEEDLSKTQIYFQNESQDMEVGRHKFDWMHLAGFCTTTASNDTCDNVDEQTHIFFIDFNMEQTDSMQFWLERSKSNVMNSMQLVQDDTDICTFNPISPGLFGGIITRGEGGGVISEIHIGLSQSMLTKWC